MLNLPYHIILASNSPRRKELLAGLDLEFTVRTVGGIDEGYPSGLNREQIALHIATNKAGAYLATLADDELVITADTIVYSEGNGQNPMVLGKPADAEDACRMLKVLSGHTHQVITGVCLVTKNFQKTFAVTSDVTFTDLTDEEISYYVNKYRPFDKAGAYGIQEWIGYVGVSRIEGSYFNVMGLPVQRLYQELKSFQ